MVVALGDMVGRVEGGLVEYFNLPVISMMLSLKWLLTRIHKRGAKWGHWTDRGVKSALWKIPLN